MISLLFYIGGVLVIVGGIVAAIITLQQEAISGIVALFAAVLVGLFYIVLGKILKEAAYILADIADSVTDLNSRYDQQQ